jgi:2-polyprenyl-6-hydroxyphenyl methylase/3-demethylubiquinone-9 3-methyltransferase
VAIHAQEVSAGERFEFGANWRRFLSTLSDERIATAERSLQAMLRIDRLDGRRFLDAGSGSGLFSLAARRLGATVVSFDYDPMSVACTTELKSRYLPSDPHWDVFEGSALDPTFLQRLGKFDVVYSWGVLHHTGSMWEAMGNVAELVAPNGVIFIAIYNDQGPWSRRWLGIKRTYNRLPRQFRPMFGLLVMGPRELWRLVSATVRGNLLGYIDSVRNYHRHSLRGMSLWHDLIDWVGGYPFEVARPERVFEFFRERGFQLTALTTSAGGIACNQFVFANNK